MKVIKKIENVNKFDLIMDSEIIWHDDIIELNGNIIFKDRIFNFTGFNDIVLINKNKGDICSILNLKSKKIKEIKLNGNLLNDEILLVGKWNNDFTERVVSAHNLEDNSILWQSKLGFSKKIVINDIFYIGNNNIISKHYVNTAISLWQYDLSELGNWKDSTNADQQYDVKDFVGVIDAFLFLKLNANEILVLDVNTGKVSERLRHIDYFEGETCIERSSLDIPFFQTRYIINQDKSIIQGLFLDLYYEVSFINGKSNTRVFGLKKEYEKWGIDPRNISKENVLFNDKLYFLAHKQGRFGILNTITKEIDYVSDPIGIGDRPNSFTQLKEIQVSEDKVYVLASDRTLHVFEKSNQ